MIGRDNRSFPHIFGDGRFVNRQRECLPDMDVIEWLCQVVHRVIVDPLQRNLVKIAAFLICGVCRDRYASGIKLPVR